jgi:hypothetical protein
LELNSPNDRTVAINSTGAARTIKTIEREELANYEAPGSVGLEWLVPGANQRARARERLRETWISRLKEQIGSAVIAKLR